MIMPSPYSSSGTQGDARVLAENLGIELPRAVDRRADGALRPRAGPRLRRPREGHHRGEPPGPHPRQPADGDVQQVRLAGPDDRQQVRDVGRLLDALRRQRRRLRGHQGLPEAVGLPVGRRPRAARRRTRRSRSRSSPARPRPSCAPTRRTRTRCRPTRSSTRSCWATSRRTSAASSSSPAACPRPTSTASCASSTSPSTSAASSRPASRSPPRPSAATAACRSPTATAGSYRTAIVIRTSEQRRCSSSVISTSQTQVVRPRWRTRASAWMVPAEDRAQERGLVGEALGRLAVGLDGVPGAHRGDRLGDRGEDAAVHEAGGLLEVVGHVDVGANLAGVEVDGVDDEAVKAVESGFGA